MLPNHSAIAPKTPLIRSVLIAGGPYAGGENHYSRLCQDYFLNYSTILETDGTKMIPMNHDAAILIGTALSHDGMWKIKEAYKGKPIYFAQNGVSSIKEEFEADVFGDGILKRLRDFSDIIGDDGNFKRGGYPATHFNVTARFYWVLGRFCKRGQRFKRSDFCPRFERLLKQELGSTATNILTKGTEIGAFEQEGNGQYKFLGIPPKYREAYEHNEIPFEDDWFLGAPKPKIISLPTPTQIVESISEIDNALQRFGDINVDALELRKEMPTPKPTATTGSLAADTVATIELLLESMARQQSTIDGLKSMIEAEVPKIIQREIRGITTLLGSLVPKLQGLTPEEITKVDQMLDLFLGMRS